MNKKNYIQAFKDVHGDKYDYSLFQYSGARGKSIIICPIHGEFNQTATNHINGNQCPDCANTQRRMAALNNSKNKEEKIDFAKERSRKMKYDADLAQLKYEEQMELLVPAEVVTGVVEREYSIIRTHILSLPNILAPTLVGKTEKQIFKEIKTKVNKILNGLSKADSILQFKDAENKTET